MNSPWSFPPTPPSSPTPGRPSKPPHSFPRDTDVIPSNPFHKHPHHAPPTTLTTQHISIPTTTHLTTQNDITIQLGDSISAISERGVFHHVQPPHLRKLQSAPASQPSLPSCSSRPCWCLIKGRCPWSCAAARDAEHVYASLLAERGVAYSTLSSLVACSSDFCGDFGENVPHFEWLVIGVCCGD